MKPRVFMSWARAAGADGPLSVCAPLFPFDPARGLPLIEGAARVVSSQPARRINPGTAGNPWFASLKLGAASAAPAFSQVHP